MQAEVLSEQPTILEEIVERYVAAFPKSITERSYQRVAYDGKEFRIESSLCKIEFSLEDNILLGEITHFRELSRERAKRYVEESKFLSLTREGKRQYIDGFTFLFLYEHPDTRYETETILGARAALGISEAELEQLYDAGIIEPVMTSRWGVQPNSYDVQQVYVQIWERLRDEFQKNNLPKDNFPMREIPIAEDVGTSGSVHNAPISPYTPLNRFSVFELVQQLLQDPGLTINDVFPSLAEHTGLSMERILKPHFDPDTLFVQSAGLYLFKERFEVGPNVIEEMTGIPAQTIPYRVVAFRRKLATFQNNLYDATKSPYQDYSLSHAVSPRSNPHAPFVFKTIDELFGDESLTPEQALSVLAERTNLPVETLLVNKDPYTTLVRRGGMFVYRSKFDIKLEAVAALFHCNPCNVSRSCTLYRLSRAQFEEASEAAESLPTKSIPEEKALLPLGYSWECPPSSPKRISPKRIRNDIAYEKLEEKIRIGHRLGFTQLETARYVGTTPHIVNKIRANLELKKKRITGRDSSYLLNAKGKKQSFNVRRPEGLLGTAYLLTRLPTLEDPVAFLAEIPASFSDAEQAEDLLLSEEIVPVHTLSFILGFSPEQLVAKAGAYYRLGEKEYVPLTLLSSKKYRDNGTHPKLLDSQKDIQNIEEHISLESPRLEPVELQNLFLGVLESAPPPLPPAELRALFTTKDILHREIAKNTGLRGDSLCAFLYLMEDNTMLKTPKESFDKRGGIVELQRILPLEARLGQTLQTIVERNLRLALMVANKEHQKRNRLGVELTDVCQDAIFGLFRAAETFEVERGYAFSSYAYKWIQKHVLCSLQDDSAVWFPLHLRQRKAFIHRVDAGLRAKEGEVDLGLVAQEVGLSPKQVQEALAVKRPASLNRPLQHYEKDVEPIEFLPSTDLSPEEVVVRKSFHGKLWEHVLQSDLEPREKDVLYLRFGLDGNGRRTLKEVAQKLSCSRELVRLIEADALLKMRKVLKPEDWLLEA